MGQSESTDGCEAEEPPDEGPIVLVSSYPPRDCGIATFTEEKREYIEAALRSRGINRDMHVICHTDGRGRNVHPDINISDEKWPERVAKEIHDLKPKPYVVDIQHEFGLYSNKDPVSNDGFLHLMELLEDCPTVIEAHTIHGILANPESEFVIEAPKKCNIFIIKCDFQKWRMEWSKLNDDNVKVIPHGVMPYKWDLDRDTCRAELRERYEGLEGLDGRLTIGLIGWMQRNKRWDIITDVFEELHNKVYGETGEDWRLVAAGKPRGGKEHHDAADIYRDHIRELERKGLALYVELIPRGDDYYKMMACFDILALPSLDETQSGTMARALATATPFITTAPMEGLTAQTVDSDAGLLFTNKRTLKRNLYKLMTQPERRKELSNNAIKYVQEIASWEVVTNQYLDCYQMARQAHPKHEKPVFPREFSYV